MRFLKRIVSLWMAMLITLTSVGFAVFAHTCSTSGFAEASIKPLKICCKVAEGKGIQAVPCCKLTVTHVKLPTVRTAVEVVKVPLLPAATGFVAIPSASSLHCADSEGVVDEPDPPESPPLATGRAIHTYCCRFLI